MWAGADDQMCWADEACESDEVSCTRGRRKKVKEGDEAHDSDEEEEEGKRSVAGWGWSGCLPMCSRLVTPHAGR
jgi:hypothetical protein